MLIIKGNDRAEDRKDRYGQYATSALGRAYAAGLLGEGTESKARYDAGERFSRLYSVFVERGRYGCPIGREQRSLGGAEEIRGIAASLPAQDWLFAAMDALDGQKLRPWLDMLLLDFYHDNDPPFLSRLLRHGRDPVDAAMMARCIEALDAITQDIPRARIRVA